LAAEGIEGPVLIGECGVGCIDEREARGFVETSAGEAVSGGAVAEAVGSVREVEEELVLALAEGEVGLVEGGLAVVRDRHPAARGGVVDQIEGVVVGFVAGDGTGGDDVGAEGVADVSGVGGEDAEFSDGGGGCVFEFEADAAGGDGGEGND
jgi:hypothetical protein